MRYAVDHLGMLKCSTFISEIQVVLNIVFWSLEHISPLLTTVHSECNDNFTWLDHIKTQLFNFHGHINSITVNNQITVPIRPDVFTGTWVI